MGLIEIGIGLIVFDLIMTIVWHKPLFKPGPIAKFMYSGLDDDDGVI
jgi:hypothetical protein